MGGNLFMLLYCSITLVNVECLLYLTSTVGTFCYLSTIHVGSQLSGPCSYFTQGDTKFQLIIVS